MSATITLKQTMARSSDVVLKLVQYSLMIAGLFLVLGFFGNFSKSTLSAGLLKADPSELSAADETSEVVAESEAAAPALSPGMQGALDYVTRRYRVSQEALEPVFEVAQMIGKERHRSAADRGDDRH